eukprot:TRINITY_DN4703_c0_g1_i1.p1 TRINITY_DN4703_c0_g1~~TRINITY_DN4703_c0_g1_i1.p1  ORF type:complete len:812 (+),score=238.89 TRINITY_DN4703_c0_g1_i1:113-2548(+)
MSPVLAVFLGVAVLALVIGILYMQKTCRRRIRQQKQLTAEELAKGANEIQMEHQRKQNHLRTEAEEPQYDGLAGVVPMTVDEQELLGKALLHLSSPGIPLTSEEELEGGAHWLPRGAGAWMVGGKNAVLSDLRVLMNEVKRTFFEKKGNLLDEFVVNLPFAKHPHPHVLLRELSAEVWKRYGAAHPTRSPLMLLAMLLYTQEVPDVDRLLLYGAPLWIEGSSANKQLWYEHLEKANRPTIRAEVDQAMQELWKATCGTEDMYQQARARCRKWVKTLSLLSSLAEETPQPLELYKTGLNIPTAIVAEFDKAEVDAGAATQGEQKKRRMKKYTAWASPVFCSTSSRSVRSNKVDVAGKVTLRFHNVTLALDFSGVSQYPGEKAYMIPPFSLFQIENVAKDELLGTVVDLSFAGTLLSHATDCAFLRVSRNEVWATESQVARIRHLMEAITVTEEVPDTLYVTTGSVWDKGSIATKYSLSTRRVRGQPLWRAISGQWYIFTSASSTRWTIGRSPEAGGGRIMSEPHLAGMPHLMQRWLRSSGPSSDRGWAVDASIKVSTRAAAEPSHQLGRWEGDVCADFSSDEGTTSIGSHYDYGGAVPLLCDDRRSESPSGSPAYTLGSEYGYQPPQPAAEAQDALPPPPVFLQPSPVEEIVAEGAHSKLDPPEPLSVADSVTSAAPASEASVPAWTGATRTQLQALQGSWVTSAGVAVQVASLGVTFSAAARGAQPMYCVLKAADDRVRLGGVYATHCDAEHGVVGWSDGDVWSRAPAADAPLGAPAADAPLGAPAVSPKRIQATLLQRRDMSPRPPPSLG